MTAAPPAPRAPETPSAEPEADAAEAPVAADERLAGTSTGETLIRVGQLLLGATGFVLVALGLASILGQVIS